MKWLQQLRQRLGFAPPAAIPAERWMPIEAGLPFLDWLDADERRRLRALAEAFLREKQFWGAHQLELTDAMLMSIALQACLPILNRGLSVYRGWVGVIVYPGEFLVRRNVMDTAGVVHEYEEPLAGEAWEGGPVVISWHTGEWEADEGCNVIIHEFAHKLDMENGEVDGLPSLPPDMSRQAWADAFAPAYDALCDAVDHDLEAPIDPYGAENPGEFFAVCVEYFFTAPEHLNQVFPAVYRQLAQYFAADPLARRITLGEDVLATPAPDLFQSSG